MRDPEILDALFREAVSAIDAGDTTALEHLLAAHPRLVRDRLDSPGPWLRDKVGRALNGFFRKPYLLWFVAEDPARTGKLPKNIAQVARTIVQAAERERVVSLRKQVDFALRRAIRRWMPMHGRFSVREQLDYALRLVAWSGVARECAVQNELIDVLVDAGASPDGIPDNALVNGHFAAAEHLVERGASLTLATALCLGRSDDVTRLAQAASAREKQMGLVLAALNGKAESLAMSIGLGVDLNAPSPDLYSHATPLHHAVCSGSLDTVKVLVEAGAELGTRDKAENATPLGWAEYYQGERKHDERGKRYAEIAAYLREKGGQR